MLGVVVSIVAFRGGLEVVPVVMNGRPLQLLPNSALHVPIKLAGLHEHYLNELPTRS